MQIDSTLDGGFFNEFSVYPKTHVHKGFELMISLDAAFRLNFLGEGSVIVRPGDICLIPPGVYHATGIIEEKPRKLAICFCYRQKKHMDQTNAFWEDCHRRLVSFQLPKVFERQDELCHMLQTINREICNDGMASHIYVHAMITQFYVCFLRLICEENISTRMHTKTVADEKKLRRIQIEDYLFERLREDVTEETLARSLNLSKRQLNRVLGELFGMSFRQMLIDIRIHRAAQLLLETEMSIEDIMEEVGYRSRSGFYTAFRNKFNISAGKYRESLENKEMFERET